MHQARTSTDWRNNYEKNSDYRSLAFRGSRCDRVVHRPDTGLGAIAFADAGAAAGNYVGRPGTDERWV